ncbi:hypothetical protein QVD17_34931 [Tagetes erecta]|uniref:Uncharacterized protein n=1 Tax=Tagetes erecta TaxID=13708 RepID=A0AAD8NM44_TARER|nr:hypothetical protein QVD17_34931 [Tagetes erecta]
MSVEGPKYEEVALMAQSEHQRHKSDFVADVLMISPTDLSASCYNDAADLNKPLCWCNSVVATVISVMMFHIDRFAN